MSKLKIIIKGLPKDGGDSKITYQVKKAGTTDWLPKVSVQNPSMSNTTGTYEIDNLAKNNVIKYKHTLLNHDDINSDEITIDIKDVTKEHTVHSNLQPETPETPKNPEGDIESDKEQKENDPVMEEIKAILTRNSFYVGICAGRHFLDKTKPTTPKNANVNEETLKKFFKEFKNYLFSKEDIHLYKMLKEKFQNS